MDQSVETPRPAEPEASENIEAILTNDILEMMFDTIRLRPTDTPERLADRRKAAVAAVVALKPQHDPVGIMLATHAVAAHHGTMECFRRAMAANGDSSAATRLHHSATKLSRMTVQTVNELARRGAQHCEGKTP